MFEPHHYLKLPRMVAAKYYVGFVDGEAVCHMAASPKLKSWRHARLPHGGYARMAGAGVGNEVLKRSLPVSIHRGEQIP